MKKRFPILLLLCFMLVAFPMTAAAKENKLIHNGIYAGDIDLGGMTEGEAKEAIDSYVAELSGKVITLNYRDLGEVTVTAGELGLRWTNEDIVAEALALGKDGNIIQRYKAIKDLENENKVFDIQIDFDKDLINEVITDKCVIYDCAPVNMGLKLEDGNFTTIPGSIGYELDIAASTKNVYDFMFNDWDRKAVETDLDVSELMPKGTEEEMSQVRDLLGTFSTSYSTSGSSRSANVANGCRLIDGTVLFPGEEFSTYETVSPFSEKNGYYLAGSYLNGKVVDSLGGGICQVSSTLYNAVLLSELEVTERHNHSMIVTYVSASSDAAISESAGKDFKFVNNTDYPIYIDGHVKNKRIYFSIYGKETRAESHKVKYESEITETKVPEEDVITADAGQPIGYVSTQSAHIGYKARLWKVVYENGNEVSREQINSSVYNMAPRYATVGVASPNPDATNEMLAAIGTGNLDHVMEVIAIVSSWQ